MMVMMMIDDDDDDDDDPHTPTVCLPPRILTRFTFNDMSLSPYFGKIYP